MSIRKVALLSVDNHPEYLFLLPIVCQSWAIQGWECFVAFNNLSNDKINLCLKYIKNLYPLHHIIEKVSQTQNKALYTQCERMYMPKLIEDNSVYAIMSDVDMFIASDFLNRDYDLINSFGFDLTGFSQIPMCYVGMTVDKWKFLMQDFNLEKDLDIYAKKNSEDFYAAWGCDQDILTGRIRGILGYHSVNFVHRGNDPTNSGLPKGRLDRHNWQYPAQQIHDCHLLRNPYSTENIEKIKEMCKKIYPEADWSWIDDYLIEFKQICNV